MLNVFKYFFGIIAVLVLIYLIMTMFRSFMYDRDLFNFSAKLSDNLIDKPDIEKPLKPQTGSSFSEFMSKIFSPTVFAPLKVVLDPLPTTPVKTKSLPAKSFWEVDYDEWYENSITKKIFDSKRTTYPPTENLDEMDIHEHQTKTTSELEPDPNYIFPFLVPHQKIEQYSTIHGQAYYKVFHKRRFPIYVLDTDGNTLAGFYAYVNGDVEENGFVKFRAVARLRAYLPDTGYLLFKNEMPEMDNLRAVTLIPVTFDTY